MKKGIRVTPVGQSLKSTLKVLNDIYLIEEDPIELTVDSTGGLTAEVVDAVKSGKLIIPDIGEYFINKFPFRGTVIAKGEKTRQDIPINSKVLFARLGGQRFEENGKQMILVRESDIHAIIC